MSNHSKENKLLHIATIGKTVGIHGDMKFHIKSDFPEQFHNGATFFTKKRDLITFENVNLKKGTIRVAGISTIEDAKKYTNVDIYTTYEDTRKNCHLDDGEFFWFDLVGCEVFEDTKLLGVVQEVERITTSDYLNIKTDEALVTEGFSKRFLVPYIKEFVLHTDIDKKIITLKGAMDILEAS